MTRYEPVETMAGKCSLANTVLGSRTSGIAKNSGAGERMPRGGVADGTRRTAGMDKNASYDRPSESDPCVSGRVRSR